MGKNEGMTSFPPRIVISMEGGLIREIVSEVPIKVLVVDFDEPDDDEKDITIIDGVKTFAGELPATVNPKQVAYFFHKVFWKNFAPPSL
jgi:hypothetical protein